MTKQQLKLVRISWDMFIYANFLTNVNNCEYLIYHNLNPLAAHPSFTDKIILKLTRASQFAVSCLLMYEEKISQET